MTTRKEQIIEKIQALMARANHPTANEHEAVACAAKAAELMQKYGIESIELKEKSSITHTVINTNQAAWIGLLACVIRDAFNVEVIHMVKSGYMFIGESANIDIITFIFEQLRNKIDILSKAYAKQWFVDFVNKEGMSYEYYASKTRKMRTKPAQKQFIIKSFTIGLIAELRKKMVQPRSAQPQQEGLVLLKNEINAYTKSLGMNLSMPRTTTVKVGLDARAAGNNAGRNININSGLGSKTGQKLLG